MQDQNMQTLQQGLHSAGQVSMDLGKLEDAQGYFKHSSQMAGKLCNPHAKIDATERQGQCEWQLGKFKEAQELLTFKFGQLSDSTLKPVEPEEVAPNPTEAPRGCSCRKTAVQAA